jgi:hypothetical protein
MSNILNITDSRVQFSDNFDTTRRYLYRNPDFQNLDQLLFTQTLRATNLEIYQENPDNLSLPVEDRSLYPPASPIRGPFIEKLYVGESYSTYKFINLLLIDKPPIRTGFFEFFIQDVSFTGLITRQTTYPHYNWTNVAAGLYDYILVNTPLGYGIEISDNKLYTYEVVNNEFVKVPTPLLLKLRQLTGNEEITSLATSEDPVTYVYPIGATEEDLQNLPDLPIDVYALSDADSLRYIASYSDLISSLGADPIAGRNHYNNIGFREGRTITFNPISYLNKYSDLKTTYGTDTYQATIHYIQLGFNQGRTFDLASSDVQKFGGLYDERFSNIPISLDSIIWPNGKTIFNSSKVFSYTFGSEIYFLNGTSNVNNKLEYLQVN